DGYFWGQRSTVGWQRTKTVVITVDLGHDAPVAGASFSTAAGTAGVEFPSAITVLVSVDGRTWYEAGELVSEGNTLHRPPHGSGYTAHRFWTDLWRTHGRWVKFVVDVQGVFCFVDEVEVYAGQREWLATSFAGPPLAGVEEFLVRRGIRRRIAADRDAV